MGLTSARTPGTRSSQAWRMPLEVVAEMAEGKPVLQKTCEQPGSRRRWGFGRDQDHAAAFSTRAAHHTQLGAVKRYGSPPSSPCPPQKVMWR